MCAFVPCLLPVPVQMFFSEGVFVWMFRNDPVFVFQNEPCTTGSYHTTEALYHTMHIHDHPCTNLRLYPHPVHFVAVSALFSDVFSDARPWDFSEPEAYHARVDNSPACAQQLTTDLSLFVKSSTDVGQTYGPNYAELQLCWQRRFLHIPHILYQICINMIQYVWIIMFTYISLYNII